MGSVVIFLATLFLLVFLSSFTILNCNPRIEGYETNFAFVRLFKIGLKVQYKKKNTDETNQ